MPGPSRGTRVSEKVLRESVHDAVRSAGRPLTTEVRAILEPRFGYDFSRVRVHADAAAAASGRAVGARAYTIGSDIVFGAGEFRPDSRAGLAVIAHELAHVVQQDGIHHPLTRRLVLTSARDPDERAAERAAQAAFREMGPGVEPTTPLAPGMLASGLATREAAVIHRFESPEHVELGGDTASAIPGGGYIILEAHRRELPNHATPTVGWPPEWVELWKHRTPQQERAIRDGLTYGEVIALAGDLYAAVDSSGTTDIAQSVDRLNHASLREIWDLIPLIHDTKADTNEFQKATGSRYLALARKNLSHFSNVPAGQRNIDVWREGHTQAIRLARAGQADMAWLTNAAADHFLTDAFSGGHLRQERAKLGPVDAKVEHDLDNEHGVLVTNARGDGPWTAYGDSHLDDKKDESNRRLALEAVASSKADIADALARGSAYPDPPSPLPTGAFTAESIVPRPVDSRATNWNWFQKAYKYLQLAGSEGAELFRADDTRIREWVARQPPGAIRDVPVEEKLRMINRLLDGWVSDDDLEAIERIQVNSTYPDRIIIMTAVEPRVGSLTSPRQRRRLRSIIFGGSLGDYELARGGSAPA